VIAENDPSRFDGYAHELDEHIPWGVGHEILELAFFGHRWQFEQPGERRDVHKNRRFQSSLDDAESKTAFETLLMVIEGIVNIIQPFSKVSLSPRLDIP